MKIIAAIISQIFLSQLALAGIEGTFENKGTFFSTHGETNYSVSVSIDLSAAKYEVNYVLDDNSWTCRYVYDLTLDSNGSFNVFSVTTNGVRHESSQPLAQGAVDRQNGTFAIVSNHPSTCNDGGVSHWSIHSRLINGKLVRIGINLDDTPTYRLRDSEI